MKEQDKKEIRQIFNEGIEQLVLPRFDEVYGEIKEVRTELKKEIRKVREDLGSDIYRLERKLDAEISWRDEASKRLKRVEIEVGLAK